MLRVVFPDRATFGSTVDSTRPDTPHEWVEFEKTREDQVVERLAGAQIAITNKVPLRAATLAQLLDPKMISVAATGYDIIDTVAWHERNIRVSNVRGYANYMVPEHTFALLLISRRLSRPILMMCNAGNGKKPVRSAFSIIQSRIWLAPGLASLAKARSASRLPRLHVPSACC